MVAPADGIEAEGDGAIFCSCGGVFGGVVGPMGGGIGGIDTQEVESGFVIVIGELDDDRVAGEGAWVIFAGLVVKASGVVTGAAEGSPA